MVHGNEHDDSRDKHKSEYHAEPYILFFLKAHAFFPLFFHLPDISTLLKPSDEAIEAYTLFRFSNILYHQFVANLLQNAVPRKTGRFSRDKSLWPLQRNVCVVKFFSKRQKCWRGKRGARSEKAGLFKFSDRYLSLLFQCIMIAK